jgi:NAD(P)-dependent dehydrogenase (short-subunit alcohol dehydrogenase family)
MMNKVAYITGGSRGIGFGIAIALARDGFDIAINGVREEHLVQKSLNQLTTFNTEVIYCQGNVAIPEDRSRMISRIKNHFGRLDVLVNNAGIAPKQRANLLNMTEESYDDVMTTNLKGPFFLTQEIASWMIEQQQQQPGFTGMIINISSISATVVSTNRGEYCMSKAGMSMMTQLYAVTMGEYGIPVYEIRPGIVATDMTSKVKEKYDKKIDEGLCVQKRWGYPEDTGEVVSALASQKLPYSTGQVIMVDGGLTIQRL